MIKLIPDKGFPNRFLCSPWGWEDLGDVGFSYDDYSQKSFTQVHTFCATRIRVGKEGGTTFLYCPRCDEKIDHE